MHVCVCACVRACVRSCVCACVRVCVCACVKRLLGGILPQTCKEYVFFSATCAGGCHGAGETSMPSLKPTMSSICMADTMSGHACSKHTTTAHDIALPHGLQTVLCCRDRTTMDSRISAAMTYLVPAHIAMAHVIVCAYTYGTYIHGIYSYGLYSDGICSYGCIPDRSSAHK